MRDQPGVGLITVPGSPLIQPGLPPAAPAPVLGGDTADVLAALGCGPDAPYPRGDAPLSTPR